jgi:hypothetical protein
MKSQERSSCSLKVSRVPFFSEPFVPSRLIWIEVRLEALPTLVVRSVEIRTLQSPRDHSQGKWTLKHESLEWRKSKSKYSLQLGGRNYFPQITDRRSGFSTWLFNCGNVLPLLTIVPSATRTGAKLAFVAPSKQLTSGPWGVIIWWRVAPPGANPSSFASYVPRIRPMNSDMQFPVTRT